MEDEQTWARLLEEQSALFRKTIQKNAELEKRVIELERELSVWKVAFASQDQEKNELQKQNGRLERNIGSLRDDNPLVLCLIDGDGNIFSKDLVSQGRLGGSQAAQLLTKGITDYLESEDGKNKPSTSISGRAQIWVSVYYNKSGLQDILISRQLCTVEQFEAFVTGFNQASPLFSLIDVGNGKEAADTKIKEYLRVFTRFPQMSKVFFGGGHDNGYASTLNSLNNEGLLDKIVLLQGYKEVAFEIKTLRLSSVEFPGVFMTEKLPYNYQSKRNTGGDGYSQSEDERRTPRTTTNNLLASPSKPRARRQSDSSQVTKYEPPACNFYYLTSNCKAGNACKFGHAYDLNSQELMVMAINAKRSPCGPINRNQICTYGERCPLGHVCLAGPKCKFFRAGRCKFTGRGMHDLFSVHASPQKASYPHQDPSYAASSVDGPRPVTPGFESVPTDSDGTASQAPGTNSYLDAWYAKFSDSYPAHALPPN